MQKLNAKIAKIIMIIIILLGIINIKPVQATLNSTEEELNEIINNEDELSETIKNLILTINSEGMTKQLLSESINLYTETSKKYSNNEIAVIIEDNIEELVQNGVDSKNINTIVTVLKNVDTAQLKKVLETINIEEVAQQIENGKNLEEILNDITNNMSTTEKVDLVVNLLLSANIIRTVLIVIISLFIYRTLLRCVIYKKAGKRAWAPFIPIYRNVVMLRICGMSPWWLLLLFVPIIGWAFLWVVSVASKFMIAEGFGKKVGFAFGLWLLAPLFETILVISRKTKYIGFDVEENEGI